MGSFGATAGLAERVASRRCGPHGAESSQGQPASPKLAGNVLFRWTRRNLGIVGTEDGADWVIPYVDFVSLANEGRSIPVPLYNLVYHDAVLTPSGGLLDPVRCALNGGYPKIERELDVEMAQRLSELHARIGLLEMTGHEFLDESFRKERSIFLMVRR